MLEPFSHLKSSKLSYIGLPASFLLVAIIASYSILGLNTGPKDEQTALGGGRQLVSVQKRTFIKVIPVNGSLVFPNTAELTFDTRGNVGEILVRPGQRVVKGQPLAILDRIAVANLSEDVARGRFELDQAQDALERAKEEFITTPLERAEFEAEIAQARRSLEDAEEKLDDFQRDSLQDLAGARKLKADSEAALDDAQEKLADFQRDTNRTFAAALMTQADAELAMDEAVERQRFFQRDQDRDLADALKHRSEAEDALDSAQEALADFDGEYAHDLYQVCLKAA